MTCICMCERVASVWTHLLRRSKNFACLLTNSWIAILALPYAGCRGVGRLSSDLISPQRELLDSTGQ